MVISRFREVLRQGCIDAYGAALCWNKGSPPPPPDYAGAAKAQGAANKEAAIAGAQLSNPNITNPYGQQRVTYQNDPTTGNPVPYINQTLAPEQQRIFDIYGNVNQGLADLSKTGVGYVQSALNTPFNQSALPLPSVNAGQTGQEAILSRLEPQIARDREALETKLINQGLMPGGAAYGTERELQGQRENDARIQAALYGINVGDQARGRAIQEQEFMRTEPLNILNAVRSSAPVSIPQFQQYQGQPVAPAPIMAATNAGYQGALNSYNAQQAQRGNFMSGLFGLGAAGIGAYPW